MVRTLLVLAVAVVPGCAEVKGGFRPEEAPWDRSGRPPVPRGHFGVTLDTFEVAREDKTAFEALARLSEPAPVAGAAPLEANGLRILRGRGDFVSAFHAEVEKVRRTDHQSAFLVVAPGQDAKLSVVRGSVPERPLAVPLVAGSSTRRTLELAPQGTGFTIRARELPNRLVDLTVTPWVASTEGGETILTEMSTSLTVELGRPYVLFGVQGEAETAGALFLSCWKMRVRRSMVAVITVDSP
jgi:hypothetical protein